MNTVLRTDTQQIPAHSGAADTCRACLAEFGGPVEPEHSLLRLDDTTVAIPAPWLRPPVTSRHLTPRARLARRWQGVRSSRYAEDVRAGWQRALAVLGVFGIAYFSLLIVRGAWVASQLLGTVALVAIAVVPAAGFLIGHLLRQWDKATTLPDP